MTAAITLSLTSLFDSPLGPLYLQHDGNHIHALTYDHPTPTVGLEQLPTAWHQALMDYFAGEFDRLEQLPVRLREGTPFQQLVWLALPHIPAGQTVSYLQLAQHIDRPTAVRAVGQALRRNPVALLLPCHRVIRQSGDLGGYAGRSDMGQSRKRFLLWHEGGYPTVTPLPTCEPIQRVHYA
jgi:methylated-DNA-[protein]-cysteine S-methyltransferase